MRSSRIAGLVSLVLVAGVATVITAAPASAASLDIKKFEVAPSKVDAGGGKVTLTVQTKHAETCKITSSVKIKGMPAKVNCADGSATRRVTIPASHSVRQRSIVFTLTASKGTLVAHAHVTVKQDPGKPQVSGMTTSVHSVNGNKTSKVTISATVKNGATCTLSSSPKLTGLPATSKCAGGSFARTVTVPRNSSAKTRTITFTLTVKSSTGATGTMKQSLTQSAITGPGVTMSASPSSITAAGGTVTISGAVTNATTCQLTSSPDLGSSSGSCSSGTFSKAFSIPANTGASTASYAFSLKATGPGGVTTGTLTIVQPAGPTRFVTIGSSPASLTAAGSKTFTLQASLVGATSCTITETKQGLATTHPVCNKGSLSQLYNIAANTTGAPKTFMFNLSAVGPGGTAGATLTITQPAASATAPTVVSLTPSPTSLPAGGTSVDITAALTNASTCAWSSSPTLAKTGTTTCTATSSDQHFTVPANTSSGTLTYTFSIDVHGAGGEATGTITMSQPPAVALGPQITSITPDKTSLPQGGSPLTVSAKVSGAATCSITSSPNIGSVTGADCSGGTVSEAFTVPANKGTSDISYVFTVTATKNGSSATGTLTMTQPPTPPPGPQITSMTSSPTNVTYQGGPFTVTANVKNAVTCSMSSSVGSKAATSCTSGTFQGSITLPQNSGTAAAEYDVTVTATGAGSTGSVQGILRFFVPPPPPSISNLSYSPAPLTASSQSVKVTATLTGGSQCTLTATVVSVGAGTPAVSGTGSQPCTTSFTRTVTVPANSSGKIRTYQFSLEVDGEGGSSTATINVNQPSS